MEDVFFHHGEGQIAKGEEYLGELERDFMSLVVAITSSMLANCLSSYPN